MTRIVCIYIPTISCHQQHHIRYLAEFRFCKTQVYKDGIDINTVCDFILKSNVNDRTAGDVVPISANFTL